jgi:kynurenine formamidase
MTIPRQNRTTSPDPSWIVDLSVPLESDMTVFPGDPEARILQALSIASGDDVSVLICTSDHIRAPTWMPRTTC